MRFRRSASAALVAALAAVVLVPVVAASPVSAQTLADVEERDRLIAAQENLLNTYRCLFGVDTGVVPGGCPNPDTVAPGPAPAKPTQRDIDARDGLIRSQEALLNVYRCRFDVDTEIVPGGCAEGEPAPTPTPETAAADWYPDPTCRNQWRWWDGQQWTSSVGDGGPPTRDPIRPGDNLPDPGEPFDCPDPAAQSAAELGCVGDNPACRIGADGLAYATRIVSYDELTDSGGFDVSINPYVPDVAESVALGYLTDCLQEWGAFVPSYTPLFRFTATPVQACSAVWRYTAYAVNHLGVSDVDCVWGSFERLMLRGGAYYRDYAHSGWAETCASWLDPIPERQVPEWCAALDLTGWHSDISRNPQWERWGLTEYRDDYDWAKTAYCTWMEKCTDVLAQVAPGAGIASRRNDCDRGHADISGLVIAIARRGRCGGLRLLANAALGWAGGAAMPHVADRPGDQLITC